MITDPVYEGKSMQGMIDLVNKGYFPKGSKILYAHLGGTPAINGYGYTFRTGCSEAVRRRAVLTSPRLRGEVGCLGDAKHRPVRSG